MITERDNFVVKDWFEKHFYGTISQINKAYFRDLDYGYNIARTRLGEMAHAGLIKAYRDVASNRNVYILQDDKRKFNPPSMHRLIVLDILAEFMYLGFTVQKFQVEKEWLNRKYRSDGVIMCKLGDMARFAFLIEVQLATHSPNLEKYDVIAETDEVQEFLGRDRFPKILYISDTPYNGPKLKCSEIVQLDLGLHMFPKILLQNAV